MKKHLLKINKMLRIIIRIAIIILAIITALQKEYEKLGILAITMILTWYYIPVEKLLKIKLNLPIQISLNLFLFGAQCMGTVLDFYDKFSWWDMMLHTLSGLIFYFIGMSVIKQLNRKTTRAKIDPKIVGLFATCFSLAIAVIWEIIEFIIDTHLGGNMQIAKGLVGQDAIKDTMLDLISVTIGTLLIYSICLYAIKKKNKKKK